MSLLPSPVNAEIKILELHVKQLMCSMLMEEEAFSNPALRVHVDRRLEMMARQITACLRVPADVLQEDRVIDYYPDGLWQHIRYKLGMNYRKKEIRLTEWLVYPSVEIPEPHTDTVRLYVYPGITIYWDRAPDDAA